MRAWAENLPAIPDVPYSPPFNELASQIVVLPAGYEGSTESLLADWKLDDLSDEPDLSRQVR